MRQGVLAPCAVQRYARDSIEACAAMAAHRDTLTLAFCPPMVLLDCAHGWQYHKRPAFLILHTPRSSF